MSRQPKLFEPEVHIPEELREWADLWLKHKTQRRETYKSIGLALLIDQMVEWGPERTAAAVKHSIANNYSGLFEPPKKDNGVHTRKEGDTPPARYQSWMSDKTIDDWPYLDKNTRQCIIENITLGSPRRYR